MRGWIRRFFSFASPEEEAAEREEYGPSDRVERREERSFFPGEEETQAAEDELDEFKAPPDPAP